MGILKRNKGPQDAVKSEKPPLSQRLKVGVAKIGLPVWSGLKKTGSFLAKMASDPFAWLSVTTVTLLGGIIALVVTLPTEEEALQNFVEDNFDPNRCTVEKLTPSTYEVTVDHTGQRYIVEGSGIETFVATRVDPDVDPDERPSTSYGRDGASKEEPFTDLQVDCFSRNNDSPLEQMIDGLRSSVSGLTPAAIWKSAPPQLSGAPNNETLLGVVTQAHATSDSPTAAPHL